MRKQIRYRVWETNSSSCHSVTFNSNHSDSNEYEYDYSTLESYIEDDGYLHTKFGEFGWGVEDYSNSLAKLKYALTMVVETECRYRPIQSEDDTIEFEETEGFKAINDLIANKLDCAGVIVDSEMKVDKYDSLWNEGVTMIGIEHDGYIDHQSCEFSSLQDFLDYSCLTLEEFIFDTNVVLHIDNDNH